jgi:hypothetical protein
MRKRRLTCQLVAKMCQKQKDEICEFADENELTMGEATRLLLAYGMETVRQD